jgi:predicted phosphodiesterase
MILVVGDLHGEFKAFDRLIKAALKEHLTITSVVQVGDFGVGFLDEFLYAEQRYEPGKPRATKWHNRHKLPIRFCEGNHDNHELLKGIRFPYKGVEHMPRGTVATIDGLKCLFLGGAASIDKNSRTPGLTWWEGELITYGDVMKALENVDAVGGVDVVFTHERPDSFPFPDWFKDNHEESAGQRRLLDAVFEYVHPKMWFFGHYHDRQEGVVQDCRWTCCPCASEQYAYVIDQVNGVVLPFHTAKFF